MAQVSPAQVLTSIHEQRANQPLSILTLAEPILQDQATQPSQNASNDSQDQPSLNPATLAAELSHYRDLFSKLRFSYLEQVTKEKYIRSIVGDPPLIATVDDNTALEDKLVDLKTALQEKKQQSEKLVEALESLAQDIAQRYDQVNHDVQQLETLPAEIDALEAEVEEAKRQLAEREGGEQAEPSNPRMELSFEETQRLLLEQQERNEALRKEIEELESAIPRKTRECELAEQELEEIEAKRNEVTRSAREFKRRREEGGRDVMEEKGRWLNNEEIVLRGLLGLQDAEVIG